MGEIYKARDARLDHTVAIKVLPEHVASDPDLKQRFERAEIIVATQRNGPRGTVRLAFLNQCQRFANLSLE